MYTVELLTPTLLKFSARVWFSVEHEELLSTWRKTPVWFQLFSKWLDFSKLLPVSFGFDNKISKGKGKLYSFIRAEKGTLLLLLLLIYLLIALFKIIIHHRDLAIGNSLKAQ